MSQSELLPTDIAAGTAVALEFPDGPAVAVGTCWSESGVYGSRQCLQLEKVIHCRNCPVYSTAGVQLLNRASPADYRREWTEHFSARKPLRDAGRSSAILFR